MPFVKRYCLIIPANRTEIKWDSGTGEHPTKDSGTGECPTCLVFSS